MNKTNINVIDFIRPKSLSVIIGSIYEIKNFNGFQIININYISEENKIETKKIRYNPQILNIALSLNDIIIWSDKNTYIVFNGLLIPIIGRNRTTHKITPKSIDLIIQKQQDIFKLKSNDFPLQR